MNAIPMPTILIDSREQRPLVFRTMPTQRATLTSGDYSVAGLEQTFAVERKSVPDLASCVGRHRERFERELHRLRGYRFARLLIVGVPAEITTHRYHGSVAPKSIHHSLAAWEIRYVPVVWAETPERAAALIERWAYWLARETLMAAGKFTAGTCVCP